MATTPKNLRPFRRILTKLNKKLSKSCVEGKDFEHRVFHNQAWCIFLLFDLRYAPMDKVGFRNIDPLLVNKYQPKFVKGRFGREECEEPPVCWIEQSLDSLIDNEIIHYNGKAHEHMRLRPSKYLLKLWDEMDVLEGQFNPYANDDQVTINKLFRDVKRLRMIVRELCKLTGCELEP